MPPKPFLTERVVFFAVFLTFILWLTVLFTFSRHVPEDPGFVTRSLHESSISHRFSESESDLPVKGWENVTDLIMVAGHTIFIGSNYGESTVNESHWYYVPISNQ
jgi:hypothetical protein